MSWISTIEILPDRTAEQSEDGTCSYTRSFNVYFSDLQDGPKCAREAPGIPRIKESYAAGNDLDVAALVTRITPAFKAPLHWVVTVEYATSTKEYENPTDEAPEFSGSISGSGTIALLKDVITGDPVLNSAKQPFAEAPEVIQGFMKFQVGVNTVENPLVFGGTFFNKRNDAAWQGFPEKTVRCADIQFDLKKTTVDNRPFHYFHVTYVFEVDLENEWKIKVLDCGFKELVGGVAKNIQIDGEDIVEPMPLDGAGVRKAIGAPAVFLEFDGYKLTDFSALPGKWA